MAATRSTRRKLLEAVDGSLSSGWNSPWNRFQLLLNSGSMSGAQDLTARTEGVSQRMMTIFPERFVVVRQVLNLDIAATRTEYSKEYSALSSHSKSKSLPS